MDREGFEPSTSRVSDGDSNRAELPVHGGTFHSKCPASVRAALRKLATQENLFRAGAGGFEPPQPGPKPDVLPLDNAPSVVMIHRGGDGAAQRWKRKEGLEPSTFCVARRCSGQLSYSRKFDTSRPIADVEWTVPDLNRRPSGCEPDALPTELTAHVRRRSHRGVLQMDRAGLEPATSTMPSWRSPN